MIENKSIRYLFIFSYFCILIGFGGPFLLTILAALGIVNLDWGIIGVWVYGSILFVFGLIVMAFTLALSKDEQNKLHGENNSQAVDIKQK